MLDYENANIMNENTDDEDDDEDEELMDEDDDKNNHWNCRCLLMMNRR